MPRMLDRIEERRLARKVARQALIESGGDAKAAKDSLPARFEKVGIDPMTILLLIKIAIMFIDWWASRKEQAPPEMEALEEQPVASEADGMLWGSPPSKRPRVRGSYEASGYSPKGKMGARDAGSIFENAVILTPIITATSYQIEALAMKSAPGLPMGLAGVSSWLFQVAVWLGLKALANTMRNYGASLLRDIGAWVWSQFLEGLWSGVKDSLRSLWPFGRRRRRWIIPGDPEENEDRAPRRRLVDILFPRKRRRRTWR